MPMPPWFGWGLPISWVTFVSPTGGLSRTSVPSGASIGKYEAFELRDAGRRYLGKGVLKTVSNVNNVIAKKLLRQDCIKQKEADELMNELDDTLSKFNKREVKLFKKWVGRLRFTRKRTT